MTYTQTSSLQSITFLCVLCPMGSLKLQSLRNSAHFICCIELQTFVVLCFCTANTWDPKALIICEYRNHSFSTEMQPALK